MGYKVDNAIIMAAGLSSRLYPLTISKPKCLIKVKNEILIERLIEQLIEAQIPEIVVVVGYKKELLYYLKEKYNVVIIENNEYLSRNNVGSLWAARSYLKNSYICSCDNYYTINPFEKIVDESYYSTIFSSGKTAEWCVHTDKLGYISDITIGGKNQWYMIGHAFWSHEFSNIFLDILYDEYDQYTAKYELWEKLLAQHLDSLKMITRKYNAGDIYEFDTLEELQLFDSTYVVT